MADYWVKLRGMPYRTTMDDIIEFMDGIGIKGGKRGIHFPVNQKNVEWGEAFIELESESDLEKAKEKNNEHMGRRYIEVFTSSEADMNKACKATNEETGGHSRRHRSRSPVHDRSQRNHVLRLKGLPYNAAKGDLKEFFEGLKILPDGMSILVDHSGKALGDAFVQFASFRDAKQAKERSGKRIGHRYIEVFESTLEEANSEIRRQMEINEMRTHGDRTPPRSREDVRYPRPTIVLIRNVSVHTRADDIFRFFRPIMPSSLELKFSRTSPEGEALVEFVNEEDAYNVVSRNRDRPLDGVPLIMSVISPSSSAHLPIPTGVREHVMGGGYDPSMDRERGEHRGAGRGAMGSRYGEDYYSKGYY